MMSRRKLEFYSQLRVHKTTHTRLLKVRKIIWKMRPPRECDSMNAAIVFLLDQWEATQAREDRP